MSISTGKIAKLFALSSALFIFVLGILAILFYFYLLPGLLDPQGDVRSGCIRDDLPTISNGAGMVVSGHHTYCDDVVHDSAVYVYLHKQEDAESRSTLIFRYADKPDVSDPRFEWNDHSTLSISVGDVIQISKMTSSKDGIKINYSIGKEEDTLAKAEQGKRELEEWSVLPFIGLIVLLWGSRRLTKAILKCDSVAAR